MVEMNQEDKMKVYNAIRDIVGNRMSFEEEEDMNHEPEIEEDIFIPKQEPLKKKVDITLYEDLKRESWFGFKVDRDTFGYIAQAMNAVADFFGSEVIFMNGKILIDVEGGTETVEIGKCEL